MPSSARKKKVDRLHVEEEGLDHVLRYLALGEVDEVAALDLERVVEVDLRALVFLGCDVVRRGLHSFPTRRSSDLPVRAGRRHRHRGPGAVPARARRSEEHTSELQSHVNLVCRLLLEKKKLTACMSKKKAWIMFFATWPLARSTK